MMKSQPYPNHIRPGIGIPNKFIKILFNQPVITGQTGTILLVLKELLMGKNVYPGNLLFISISYIILFYIK